MGGRLGNSIWIDTILENFLIVHLKFVYHFNIYCTENWHFTSCHSLFSIGQTGDHRIKPVSPFLPASPVGEQTGEDKLAALAASQIVFSGEQTTYN
jgi:hypothetical protein